MTLIPPPAEFYFDLASPYAYLASGRVDALLGDGTIWRPILVGALHKHFRRVSWGATPELRAAGVAEIEARAAAFDIPAIRWPQPYPANTLTAMRAAIWAAEKGETRGFAHAAYQMAFASPPASTASRRLMRGACCGGAITSSRRLRCITGSAPNPTAGRCQLPSLGLSGEFGRECFGPVGVELG